MHLSNDETLHRIQTPVAVKFTVRVGLRRSGKSVCVVVVGGGLRAKTLIKLQSSFYCSFGLHNTHTFKTAFWGLGIVLVDGALTD